MKSFQVTDGKRLALTCLLGLTSSDCMESSVVKVNVDSIEKGSVID